MKSEWKTVEFGEILDIPLRNGLTKPKSIRGSGCKLINMGELFKYNRISTGLDMDRVPVTLDELNNTNVKKWDLLFARQSLVLSGAGKCSIVWDDIDIAVFESHLIRARLNNDKALGLFYYYYFSSFAGKKNIESIVEQVAAAGIRGSDLVHLKVPLPPRREQKAIAATLACLDDKIELNNRINKNLEAQAQAIFKSWFVDFEPFQEGEFVDSELGKIPKGWKVGTVADLGDIVGGSTPSKAKPEYYTDKGIAWLTPKDLSIQKNKFIFHGETDITELGLKNSSARLMPKGTVLFSSRAPIGYIAIAGNVVSTNQGFKSIVPFSYIGTPYVYLYLKTNLERIESSASGSTFREVSGSTMKNIPALIPCNNALIQFTQLCDTIFLQQQKLEQQNKTLSTLRDTLLPKLMSGEIQIPQEV